MDEVTPFYFHPCAKISASWLFDRHIRVMLIQTSKFLSLGYTLTMLHEDDKLTPTREVAKNPWFRWMITSIDHAEWLREYYETLSNLHDDIFGGSTKLYETLPLFRDFIRHLPHSGWTNPPTNVPVDCVTGDICISYRLYYVRAFARGPVYRRVRAPYWIRDHRERV